MKYIERDRAKLTAQELSELDSKGWRSRHADEFPPVAGDCRPSDYDNDLDRGTIDYNLEWRNYSFHKVRIPSGTVVRNCNFTQANPDTNAITVVGNPQTVSFIDCNMTNVRVLPGWRLEGCNNGQKWLVEELNQETGEMEEKRIYLSRTYEDLPNPLIEPDNIKKKRAF